MKERQAWCYLQVKLCDPCLSALSVPPWPKKAPYKYSSFPFPFIVNAITSKHGQVKHAPQLSFY